MKSIQIASVSALFFLALSANAAMVQLVGDDVTFTYDDSTAYGSANVVGNSLTFSPISFLAESSDGGGLAFSTSTLNIEIEVNEGSSFVIGSLGIAEYGDYQLSGSGSSVSADGRLQVKSLTTLCGLFVCQDSDIFSAGALTNVGALTEWSAASFIDFSWGNDSRIQAQIQNNLVANSFQGVFGSGGLAFIQKKSVGLGLMVIPEVPVPAAAWLFGSALLGLVAVKRRT